MTTTLKSNRSCSYGYEKPEEFSEWDQRDITRRLARRLPKRQPPRRKLFGVSFPAGLDTQHVVFTEKFRDACHVLGDGHRWKVWSVPGAPLPDGKDSLPPRA